MRARGQLRCVALGLGLAGSVGGCQGCKRDAAQEPAQEPAAALPLAAPAPQVAAVKESLPRCRVDGARLPLPGDEVVTGDAAVTSDALFLGVVRREGTRRIGSVLRASLDLGRVSVIDVGVSLGDDPPPSPRARGAAVYVASFARSARGASDAAAPAAAMTRVLELARLDEATLRGEGRVVQQADESLAFDLAWPEADPAAPLVAWDEDAPARDGARADRGVVKVEVMGAGGKPRVVSPDSTDAESPRLLPRRGGFWLAWLARRAETAEDAGASGADEGPGEHRAYRWVEIVQLDARGELASAVRRVSPEKGHVASFELASAGPAAPLVVMVQDEGAHVEGAGERVVRYAVDGDRVESGELLDGGVGHALVDLLAPQLGDASSPRWLAFSDPQERAHLVPLGPALRLAGLAVAEPALDGARVVASLAPDVVYAVGPSASSPAPGAPGARPSATSGVELRRLVCR